MPECVFCQIVKGESLASRVYEDPATLAFLDIRPVNSGHILVIPKRHAASLSEMDPEDGVRVFTASQRIAAALYASGLRCQGVNLVLADGEVAGQEIFHVHVHVIPRFAGDGFGFRFGSGYWAPPGRPELDAAASRIRSALESAARRS
jgi:histidine triad (HIT) family protein